MSLRGPKLLKLCFNGWIFGLDYLQNIVNFFDVANLAIIIENFGAVWCYLCEDPLGEVVDTQSEFCGGWLKIISSHHGEYKNSDAEKSKHQVPEVWYVECVDLDRKLIRSTFVSRVIDEAQKSLGVFHLFLRVLLGSYVLKCYSIGLSQPVLIVLAEEHLFRFRTEKFDGRVTSGKVVDSKGVLMHSNFAAEKALRTPHVQKKPG